MEKDKIIELINTYWKFDNDQDTTSTWHDKQDLITAIEKLTTPEAVKPKECESEYKHTFVVDLNSQKAKDNYNKNMEILSAPTKLYFYEDGELIEVK